MYGITTLFSDPLLFIVGFIALAVSIGIHEFAHVYSAYLQGDQTGRAMGRLTLNPIRHLDPFGTFLMVMVGIGWGRPAPFNPYNLRNHRWGSALVAIAGPISNIIMIVVAGYALLALGNSLPTTNLLHIFLRSLVYLNAALAVFNLIPISPLDGSHVLEGVLGSEHPLVKTLQKYGMYILLAVFILGQNALWMFVGGGAVWLLKVLGLGQLI